MAVTVEKHHEFANAIVNPDAALPAAIEWIADNVQPGEVFNDAQLGAWAKARGWTPPVEEE